MRSTPPAPALALAVAVSSAGVAVQGRTGLLTRAFADVTCVTAGATGRVRR